MPPKAPKEFKKWFSLHLDILVWLWTSPARLCAAQLAGERNGNGQRTISPGYFRSFLAFPGRNRKRRKSQPQAVRLGPDISTVGALCGAFLRSTCDVTREGSTSPPCVQDRPVRGGKVRLQKL